MSSTFLLPLMCIVSASGPGESEHGDCHPSDTNPGKPRSLRVATGGVDMATEPRP